MLQFTYISDGIKNILKLLEDRYDLDFKQLERSRIDKIIKNDDIREANCNMNEEALKVAKNYLESFKPYLRLYSIAPLLREHYFTFEEIAYVMDNIDYEKWIKEYANSLIASEVKYTNDRSFSIFNLKKHLYDMGFDQDSVDMVIGNIEYDWSEFLNRYINELIKETSKEDEEYVKSEICFYYSEAYCESGIKKWKELMGI